MEKMGYCYPNGLEKALCKWDVYVPLVTKGLNCEKKLKTDIGSDQTRQATYIL